MPSSPDQDHHTNSNNSYKYRERIGAHTTRPDRRQFVTTGKDNMIRFSATHTPAAYVRRLEGPKNEGIATKCNASQTFSFPPVGND